MKPAKALKALAERLKLEARNSRQRIKNFIHSEKRTMTWHEKQYKEQVELVKGLVHGGLYECTSWNDPVLVIVKEFGIKSITMHKIAQATSERMWPFYSRDFRQISYEKFALKDFKPVKVSDLPLYMGWPVKDPLFDELLRTGGSGCQAEIGK